jgi:hypothetical protein
VRGNQVRQRCRDSEGQEASVAHWWSDPIGYVKTRWPLEQQMPQVRKKLRELGQGGDQDMGHVTRFGPNVSLGCIVMRLDVYTEERARRLEKRFAAWNVRVVAPKA